MVSQYPGRDDSGEHKKIGRPVTHCVCECECVGESVSVGVWGEEERNGGTRWERKRSARVDVSEYAGGVQYLLLDVIDNRCEDVDPRSDPNECHNCHLQRPPRKRHGEPRCCAAVLHLSPLAHSHALRES